MAAKRRRKRSPLLTILTLIVLLGAAVYGACNGMIDLPFLPEETESAHDVADALPVPGDGEVMYHFIDVGQGDAILITTPDGNMLIDTSISGARDELTAYLAKAGVTELEYLVLTHPDADHIGNAAYIIENYPIKKILMTDYVATTKTYEKMLDAIEASSAEVIIPAPGETYDLGALRNIVIAPNAEYDDPNEMSIVLKSVYGDTAVMLTGDAEHLSEEDILKAFRAEDLQCTILKAGHHGSSTSSSQAFLDAVDPEIVVISCGEGNKYGHPHDEAMRRFEAMGLKIYRTDLEGDIVFRTDGESFTLIGE